MNSKDLTREQLETLNKQVGRPLRWLLALQRRMERRGFTNEDELFRVTQQAYDKVHHLSVVLHYLNCDAGKS